LKGLTFEVVERVDGAQARLKHRLHRCKEDMRTGGKGGWGSGEIETGNSQQDIFRFSGMWKGWMGLRRD